MKTKTICIALASLLMCSCASNAQSWFDGKTIKESKNYVTKEIKVDNFNKITVTGSPTVVYTQRSGKPEVTVYTSDNIAEVLDIHVKDGTLYVGFKKGVSVSYRKLDIRVSSPGLNALSVTGSGEIQLANGLKTEDLTLSVAGSGDLDGNHIQCDGLKATVAGSGDLHFDDIRCATVKTSVAGSGDLVLKGLTCTSVEASVAGSGDLVLGGQAEEAQYSVAGSGDLTASGLKVKSVNASVAGSGDITCHATDYLKARTTGSGSIGYKGKPKELDLPKKNIYEL